jgi:hypothetical protein
MDASFEGGRSNRRVEDDPSWREVIAPREHHGAESTLSVSSGDLSTLGYKE